MNSKPIEIESSNYKKYLPGKILLWGQIEGHRGTQAIDKKIIFLINKRSSIPYHCWKKIYQTNASQKKENRLGWQTFQIWSNLKPNQIINPLRILFINLALSKWGTKWNSMKMNGKKCLLMKIQIKNFQL